MVTLRRVLLQIVNVVSTTLTVLTGFRENAMLQLLYGQFDDLRARLKQGRINYNIAQLDFLSTGALPDLVQVGESYDLHYTPTRSPASLGDDRSVCLRVNSISASSLALHYDDFFGRGPRREQLFLYSISPPKCTIVNFKREWIDQQCLSRDSVFRGNATACYAYMLAHFETLAHDRTVQVGSATDFGQVGVPFLKCVGRPSHGKFKYMTDHLVLQSFWAGEKYHVEIQSSECWAHSVLAGSHQSPSVGLFRTEAADAHAVVAVAVPSPHATIQVFSLGYAIVTFALVVRGLSGLFTKRERIPYPPRVTRRWRLPFVELQLWWLPKREQTNALRLTGESTVAANSWMNHWLYMWLSIAHSALHIRTLYILLEVGTWMLTKNVSLKNFLFVCTALTKLTWLSCLAHTLLWRGLHTVFHIASVRLPFGQRQVKFLQWYIDAVALFTSFKMYSVLLLVQLVCLLHVNGSTTVMQKRPGFKRPVYGGFADLASMWQSEIACDVLVICSIQLVAAHVLASLLLLLTPFRNVCGNRVLCILQKRFVFVGWDVFVAMDALGIDPYRDTTHGNTAPLTVTTHCSIAALIQQLYASGPSGWVHLAGDGALRRHDDVHGKKHDDRARWLKYPLVVAERMGFAIPPEHRYSHPETTAKRLVKLVSVRASHFFHERSSRPHSANADRPFPNGLVPAFRPRTRFQDHVLHLHAESRWGTLILEDTIHCPGHVTSVRDGRHVFAVADALHFLPADELPLLANGQLTLRIC